jgi:hypothetical protein
MAQSFTERIDQLIKGSKRENEETSAVCTTWILLTEWVNGDGDVWLEEHRTIDLPAWRRAGILNYVLTEPEHLPEEDYDD